MFIILLSGGSGKRLWPLSNDARSKQFLRVLTGKDGKRLSMAQRVWGQLKECGLGENTLIATGEGQVDIIRSQLGEDVHLVLEPERRDTFPAIALACSYIKSVIGGDEKSPVVVLPVDPYVENDYFEKIKGLEDVIVKTGADIALMGVSPLFPSEKYGYIIRENRDEQYSRVKRFKEKPSEQEAEKLIEEGALWNCGVFGFRLGYILDKLTQNGLSSKYNELHVMYEKLPKISFDYEVVEKAQNVFVVQYNGGWKDLGTWNTLTEEMSSNSIGKVVISDSCSNTHVINELGIPVVVMGAKDMAIAASPDGILITDKNESSRLKEFIKDINDRPMFEERRWGCYRVLDSIQYEDGRHVLVKHISMNPGANISYQYHELREETWTVISGEGWVKIDGNSTKIKQGDTIHVAVGAKHSIKAETRLELVETQIGTKLTEDDIIRISYDW
ncbi:MAG: sugar phosphate nucleotidyltransferase [Clostridia bacterium]|nr:sugar phosphate nucleotidyltransferase [Clostridia bacterium]